MALSKRAAHLKTSPTLALVAKAKELQAKGHDVASLTVGEPDWPTFDQASEAGIQAIREGNTKYTAAAGTIELRKAVAAQAEADFGVSYSGQECMVGPGAKFVIFSALQVLCDVDDEVILQAPYWVSYPTMIELSGARPVIGFCDQKTQFKLKAFDLEKLITPRTKAFLFCSPSNPTGVAYTHEELKAIAEVLRRHPKIYVISDDIYNKLIFDGSSCAPHLLQVAPDLKERVICVNGGSKSYSMTGWRIGWAVGPALVIKAMGDYQSQATGAPSTIAQAAALKALTQGKEEIQKVNFLLKERLNKVLPLFESLPGFKVLKPDGAFYLWIDISAHQGKSYGDRKIESDKDFCEILLNDYYVAVVPGSESGFAGSMRVSFAASIETIEKAVQRMRQFISKLK